MENSLSSATDSINLTQIPKKISVCAAFSGRHILLTGATGFLGKVLLAMILDQLPETACLYLLIRKKIVSTAHDRFEKEIMNSPVFAALQKKHGEGFRAFIQKKVKILTGDISLPDLGLPSTALQQLYDSLDLLINSGGLVDFFPNADAGLQININGALNMADFASKCKRARLIHISTCFVSGNRSGYFSGKLDISTSPNGKNFNPEQELQFLKSEIKNIYDKKINKKNTRQMLIALGKERAEQWGWQNTYCYTKALAEMLLGMRYPKQHHTIIRPSIIESALTFPLTGWNEGVNTSAPITYLLGTWYPYLIAKDVRLDVIPIDVACRGILTLSAASLKDELKGVFQLSSSEIRPVFMKKIIFMSRKWHQKNHIHNGSLKKGIITLLPAKIIDSNYFLSPKKLLSYLASFEKIANKIKATKLSWLRKKNTFAKNKIAWIQKINNIYLPFIHDNDYIFTSDAMKKYNPIENHFSFDMKNFDWEDYWIRVQMPGLNKWVYPAFKTKIPS